jgi:hypothetical protein
MACRRFWLYLPLGKGSIASPTSIGATACVVVAHQGSDWDAGPRRMGPSA